MDWIFFDTNEDSVLLRHDMNKPKIIIKKTRK